MFRLSKRTRQNLKKLDPKLKEVIIYALGSGLSDFTVTEGYRTAKRQQELFSKGRTSEGDIVTYIDGIKKKSAHQLGLAIDFIPFPFHGWNEISRFKEVGEVLKRSAKNLGYDFNYGGDWEEFKDYPHFEIVLKEE